MSDAWDKMMEETLKREAERAKRAAAPQPAESPTKEAVRRYHSKRPEQK